MRRFNRDIHMKKETGFTLIELMIVISIIGLLTTAFAYSYQVYMPRYRLNSAARELQSALQLARLSAVRQQVPIAVTFDVPTDSFQMFMDGGATPGFLDPGEQVLKQYVNPPGVHFSAPVLGGFRFNPRGFPIGGVGDCYFESKVTNEAGQLLDDYRGVRLTIAGSSRIIKSGDGVTWY
jgi:type IV fimbrial biogenesis protein FimT